MRFNLPGSIKGHQLADEVRIATGIDVVERYSYYAVDNQVEINGADIEAQAALIQSTIDAHVPDPLYFSEDRRQAHIQTIIDNFNLHSLKGKTPAQIYTMMQNAMDSWTSLADARSDLREWLPLMAAAISWIVIHQDA
jgi:hypothetical protein